MRDRFRSWLLPLLVFLFTACGDGGCSGCESCGIAPIPGGYPIAERIDNSAQVRLTSSGISFLEENIAAIIGSFLPGGLDFEVSSDDICSGGGCFIHGDIESFELTPVLPNQLRGHIRIRLTSRDAAGGRAPLRDACFDAPLVGRTCCDVDVDTGGGSRPYVGLLADIDFVAEVQPARNGYTKVVVSPGNGDSYFAEGEGIEDDDFDLSGGFLCSIGNLGFVRGFITDEINNQFGDQIQGAIDDQLCTTRGEFGCPTGTFARPDPADPGSTCRYADADDAECVPQLLGTDGQGDLGAAFLGGFSPGTHAPGQLLLASGGDGEAVNEGMSLFFYGGFRGTDRTFTTSPAHNPCVPLVDPPPLPTIARADTFRGNTIPGGGESHVAIGLSEQYMNYFGYGLFDSGMLCIGAGTRLSQQLSTGLFSLLIESIRNIAFPLEAAPIAIAVRPQAPPIIEVGPGTELEPLLDITLPGLELDFYVWSSERYIRILTYKADLGIPMNLSVVDGAIVPVITTVDAENSSVSNSELLTEEPTELADLIQAVISMFAGMITGGLGPIELPDLMGFNLLVPDNGIQGIEDGDEFLAIFADLALAPPSMYTASAETRARLLGVDVDPRVLALETFGDGPTPSVRLELEADGPSGVGYEYSWRVDGMQWSPWSADRTPVVESRAFLFQARHELEVRARIAGERGSHDQSPARVEVLIDALAPEVTAERVDAGVRVTAFDVLSPDDALTYRWRKNGGAWSEWTTLGAEAHVPVGYDDTAVDIEVQDETGNVGAARAPLIRGLPNPEGGGCECDVPGGASGSPFGGLALLAVLGLFLRRRRGQRPGCGRSGLSGFFLVSVVVLVLPATLGMQGCDCSDDPAGEPCDGMCDVEPDPSAVSGSLCCTAGNMCVSYDRDALCDPGFECPVANLTLDDMCGVGCSGCERKPALAPGLLATYLDMVVTDDGSIVLSGYSPGEPPATRYGDLVVGRYDPSAMSVGWEIVDGAPASPITNDPDGWRGGVSAAGDDVGRWTSIAEAGGNFYVAYYDLTNGALKLAIGSPGAAWNAHTVDDQGDAGRYASMVIDGTGSPVVAYLRMQAADDGSGVVQSSVLVAQAASANPGGPTDWTVAEVATAPMLCRPEHCGPGQACLEEGLCVAEAGTGDCAAACAAGEVCHLGSCKTALEAPYIEDVPPGNGLFPSLARTSAGLALVWYDRTAGNTMGSVFDGAAWGAPFLIDGYGAGDPDVGDSGMWANVVVDAADVWHVTYVDGAEESVRYARIEAGVPVTEMVDDGATDGTMRHPDGRHIVGDDASIAVTEAGEIRIAYQDATSHTVMIARRGASDTEWTVSVLDSMQETGWWVEQALVGTTSYVATFWRQETRGDKQNGVRVLTVD